MWTNPASARTYCRPRSVDRMAQLHDIMTGHINCMWQFKISSLLQHEGLLLMGQLHETGNEQIQSSAHYLFHELQMALLTIDHLVSARSCG
jgi:hypothetical protein